MSARVRIAVLFPSTGLIDGEICDMAEERGADAVIFKVAPRRVATAADAADVAAMTMEMGAPALLAEVARQAADAAPDVIAWACTSGSFLTGADVRPTQVEAMSAAVGGRPATTTSVAVLEALRTRDVGRVVAVTPYHPSIGRRFVEFLLRNGIDVLGEAHAGCGSDEQVGALELDEILRLVGRAHSPDAQAIVIPCTALRRRTLETDVPARFGVPVVLANAATLDHAVRLAKAGR